MEKKNNEANQKQPHLMSRLEIISQNLFWLGVSAPTCQTSGEAGSSGGGCCSPEGALEMSRGFANTVSMQAGEQLVGAPREGAPCSPSTPNPTHPLQGCPKHTHHASPPDPTLLCLPEKH